MSESIENAVIEKPLRPRLKSNSGSVQPAHAVLSANATTPKTGTKIRVKIKTPIPVQVGNEANTEWTPPKRSGSPNQLKELLVPVGSVILLITVLFTGYLRFVKNVDIFMPVRNRIATASYVLFSSGDNVVVSRSDLTYLVSNSENNVKSPGQIIITQPNDSASAEAHAQMESSAERTAATPSIPSELTPNTL